MEAHYEVTKPESNEGFAMAATLGVLTLLSVLVISIFANAMASFASGMTDLEKARTYFVAEAGAESAMAQLAVVLDDAVIEDSELTAIMPPTIEGFTFDSFSVVKKGGIVTEVITDGAFAGLFSLTQVVEITSIVSGRDYTTSAIMVTAKAQAIPIFQFGVFFENDLEITNGPRMDFDGWVHSNGNIYLNSANQYFGDVITTPNNLIHDRKDEHDNKTGTYVADATATYVQLDFDSRDTPDPNAFKAKSDASFDNRVKTNAYGVDSLRVPLPDGVSAVTLIQPRNGGDSPLEQEAKFAWKADWYIEVDLGSMGMGSGTVNLFSQVLANIQAEIDAFPGVNHLNHAVDDINDALVAINIPDQSEALDKLGKAKDEIGKAKDDGLPTANGNDLIDQMNEIMADINSGGNGQSVGSSALCNNNGITHTRAAGLTSPTAAQCNGIFSFNYDKWYEGREQRWVDILDIDVAALYAWIGSNSGRQTSVMYITMDTTGAQDPEGDEIYPVIRLINANSLSAPITFATQHPMYVQGHYNNNAAWYSSALVGDAITFLSTVWDDADHQVATQIRPTAADTDIYAAILAGHSGTPCDHEVAGCGFTSPYGGGLENFPRFLEDWNPEILLFRGSLVSLTFSQQSLGLWGNGPYYSPPVRDWQFDMRFNDPANMPPGTPVVGNVIHTAFRPIF